MNLIKNEHIFSHYCLFLKCMLLILSTEPIVSNPEFLKNKSQLCTLRIVGFSKLFGQLFIMTDLLSQTNQL